MRLYIGMLLTQHMIAVDLFIIVFTVVQLLFFFLIGVRWKKKKKDLATS